MTPERIEELARRLAQHYTGVDRDECDECIGIVRTAVREALDAAIGECDGGSVGCRSCAERIKRLRDGLNVDKDER